MSKSPLWKSFKLEAASIKTVVAGLYLQYIVAAILLMFIISIERMELVFLLFPFVFGHWIAEGVLIKSRFWYGLGVAYFLFSTIVLSAFLLGTNIALESASYTYVLSSPAKWIPFLSITLLDVYGIWACIILLRHIPAKPTIK
jgi:hypothetical protein